VDWAGPSSEKGQGFHSQKPTVEGARGTEVPLGRPDEFNRTGSAAPCQALQLCFRARLQEPQANETKLLALRASQPVGQWELNLPHKTQYSQGRSRCLENPLWFGVKGRTFP